MARSGKAGTRRLKVYRARLGFDETVVAAPNQGEALKAWGVHQNLFEQGEAKLESDPDATAAALAHPGAPLRRPAGSDKPFGLEAQPPASIPRVAPAAARRSRPSAAVRPKPPPKPDRSELDAAEAELKRLERAHAAELSDLEHRRRKLEDEAADLESAFKRTREAAQRRVDKARRAFDRAEH